MWARRIARRTGWSRSPLRRTSDRVEAWVTMLLIVAMVLMAPWLAAKAAHGTYRDDIRATAYERAHRFAVRAVLLEDAAWHADSSQDGRPPPDLVPTRARWSFRDGVVRTETVLARVGQRAGSTMVIWVDDRGVLSGPPGLRSPRADALLAAVLTVCAVAGGLAGVRGMIRWRSTALTTVDSADVSAIKIQTQRQAKALVSTRPHRPPRNRGAPIGAPSSQYVEDRGT